MALIDYDVLIQVNGIKITNGSLRLSNVVLVSSSDRHSLFATILYVHRNIPTTGLARYGLTFSDVRWAFLSHLPVNHCNNVDLFAKQMILAGRREWTTSALPYDDDLSAPWLIDELLVCREDGALQNQPAHLDVVIR